MRFSKNTEAKNQHMKKRMEQKSEKLQKCEYPQDGDERQKCDRAKPLLKNPERWRVVELDCNSHGSPCRNQRSETRTKSNTYDLDESQNTVNAFRGIEIDLIEELDDESDAWKNHAIIARFVGPKFPRNTIRSWIIENWGKHVMVKFLPKNFFVAIFKDEAERDKTLGLENWFLDNHPLYLQPWTPNFDPTPLAIYDKPVWIRLYSLPIEYWNESCLEKIGKTLGSLLEFDEDIIENDLYTYAKMKIVVVKMIPSSVFLFIANERWEQQIKVEKEIISCARCGSKMHNMDWCQLYV
ncbi:hypothetical protein SUGI_0977840 [Cryptomeria japonica]|nr:hypothetical protein SUGI_0977840 [Cryptomeria japonica]